MNDPRGAAPDGADAGGPVRARWSVLARSAWHWDLQVALVVSAATGVGFGVASIAPLWWWPIPLLFVSLWHAAVAVSEASGLDVRLNGTRYGALVRVTDTEIGFRAPYVITLWVSWGAVAVCGLAAALLAITDNKPLDICVSAATALLVTWSVLCVISLARMSSRHENLAAEVDSMPEVVDHFIAEQGRSEHGPMAGERR